jgi:hypothetical protein
LDYAERPAVLKPGPGPFALQKWQRLADSHGAFSPEQIRRKLVGHPARGRMENATRLELKLPLVRRVQLDALAERHGLSTAALARVAIVQMLDRHDVLLPDQGARAAGA